MKPYIDLNVGCSHELIEDVTAEKYNRDKLDCSHECEGLKTFQAYGGGCTPKIYENGFIAGCDDTNPVRISHCPFCGEELKWSN